MQISPFLSRLSTAVFVLAAFAWAGCEDNVIELDESGELLQEDLTVGDGEEAVNGLRLEVHAKGTLQNGSVFTDTHTADRPLVVMLGSGEIIDGLEQGMVGMKEGGTRRLTIPPRLAFGVREIDGIPPNSTVVFDVELLRVDSPDSMHVADVKVGTGLTAATGDTLTAHYLGYLTNGSVFDRSSQPIQFVLGGSGTTDVIEGWDVGLVGMREGGIRRLVIPPALGYGNRPRGSIPPNSTLIFEIELEKVGKK